MILGHPVYKSYYVSQKQIPIEDPKRRLPTAKVQKNWGTANDAAILIAPDLVLSCRLNVQ